MAEPIKSLPGEIWKPIPGYEGCYEASNFGRIISVGRQVPRGQHTRSVRERLLKLWVRRDGYVEVYLSKGGVVTNKAVHGLVLEAHRGPCPDGMECCHSPDRDPANNRLENLRWDTPTANQADRIKHGTVMRGEAHPGTTLTEDAVRFIRSHYVPCDLVNGREGLAKKFGVGVESISNIVTRRSWAWLS